MRITYICFIVLYEFIKGPTLVCFNEYDNVTITLNEDFSMEVNA